MGGLYRKNSRQVRGAGPGGSSSQGYPKTRFPDTHLEMADPGSVSVLFVFVPGRAAAVWGTRLGVDHLHLKLLVNSYPSALRRAKFWPRERAHFSSSISFVKRILRVNGLR